MTMPPIARYRQVADRLRQAILSAEYQPGQLLPSESELAEEYHLNRTTINKAIRLLAQEGLVVMEHGRGSFVRQPRTAIHTSAAYLARHGDDERAQWTSELRRQGLHGRQEIREVAVTTPSAEIAGFLGLDDGDQVVVRRRLLFLEQDPVQLADSYYPARLAAGTELAEPAKLRSGTVAALERLGVEPGRFHEEVSARMPTPEESSLLNLLAGVPVLRHVRVTYDHAASPVEVSEAIMAGDRHVLTYDLPAQM